MPDQEPDPMLGTVVGDCLLEEQIGQGGMGIVYRGVHQTLHIDVAVKVLPEAFASNKQSLERFYREARQAARLDHPNIVRVLNVGESGPHHFMVMRFVDGPSLADVMDTHGIFEPLVAVEVVLQVLQGLDYAHRHGCIHRDIKPDNIMLDSEKVVKITDFGLARPREQEIGLSLTHTGQIIGTPPFMPLEQWDNESIDHRIDLFALGATMYIILTGQLPYPGDTASQIWRRLLDHQIVPITDRRQSIEGKLAVVVHRLLAPRKEDRYASAADALVDLQRWYDGATRRSESGRQLGLTKLIVDSTPGREGDEARARHAERKGDGVDDVDEPPRPIDLPTPPGCDRAALAVEAAYGETEVGEDGRRAGEREADEEADTDKPDRRRHKSSISGRIISPVPVVVGVRQATPAFPIAGSVLQIFTLHECIGRGSHGEVWRASVRGGGDAVAIKIPRSDSGIQALRKEDDGVKRLLTLGGHPQVVGLRESHLEHVPPFLVFDYFEGQTVAARVSQRGPLAPLATVSLLGQIADALSAAHALGLAHQALSPSCVLINRDDTIKVTDFPVLRPDAPASLTLALSRQAAHTSDLSVHAISPEVWLPPEAHATVAALGPQSDIFALGLLAVFCLTGAIPSRKIERQLDAVNTPAALRDLVDAMTEDQPARRPETIQVVINALAECAQVLTGGDDGLFPTARHATPYGAYRHPTRDGIASGLPHRQPTTGGLRSQSRAFASGAVSSGAAGASAGRAAAVKPGALAKVVRDTTAGLWRDAIDPARIETLTFKDHGRSTITAMTLDEKALAYTGDADGAVFAWNATDGRRRWKARLGETVTAIVHYDEHVYVATAQGNLHKLDRNFGVSADQLRLGRPITALCVLRSVPALVIGLADGRLRVIDLEHARTLPDPSTPHHGAITAIATHAAGDRLFTAGTDGIVGVYRNLGSLTLDSDVPVSRRPLRALAVLNPPEPHRVVVAAGGDDAVLYVSDLPRRIATETDALAFDILAPGTAVGFPIRGIATCTGYALLFAGGASRTIRVFHPGTKRAIHEFGGLPGQAYSVYGWNEKAPIVIAGGEHGGLLGWYL